MSDLATVFAESVDTDGKKRFAVQWTDSAGTVSGDWKGEAADQGLPDIEQLLSQKQPPNYVAVVWQVDRVLRDMKRNPFGNRAIIDLYQLSWVVASEGEIPSRTLPALCKWCGVDGGKLATAEERVGAIRECYERLMHRLSVGLRVEGVGREIISELASKAAGAFGKFAK